MANYYGDMIFVNSHGMCFGEIYATDVANMITIASSGYGGRAQITSFAVNGVSNNATPDHTNDHITITKAGVYLCTCSISTTSTGGTAYVVKFAVFKNNGATPFNNVHAHRSLSGGGGDTGSISLSGMIDLAAADTIELWCWNATNTNNIIIEDVILSLLQIGGT